MLLADCKQTRHFHQRNPQTHRSASWPECIACSDKSTRWQSGKLVVGR
jgi:hypothetical protein